MKRSQLRRDTEKARAFLRRGQRSAAQSLKRTKLSPMSSSRRRAVAERARAVVNSGPREPVERDDHQFRTFVSTLVCCVDLGSNVEKVDPAHLHTKARAGDWLEREGGLVGNIMPLSRSRHEEQHLAGIQTFQARHRVDLDAVCAIVGEAYRRGWSAFALSHAAREARGYQHVDLDDPAHLPDMEAP